jgi:sigma-B regulation protein RsbU (phosphoserine phosphatase)
MKKRRGTSFSTRIALNMVGMVTILFLVLMAVVGVNSRKTMGTQAEKTAMLMLESSIGKIERIIERVHGSLVSTSWMVLDNLDGKDELFRITSRTVEESEEIDGCAIAFREGAFPGEERFCPYSWYDESGCHSKRLDSDEYNYTVIIIPQKKIE